jgi:hypothetical protein
MVLTVLIVHRVRVCYANLLYDINQSIKLYCVCYVDVHQQSCRRGEAAVMWQRQSKRQTVLTGIEPKAPHLGHRLLDLGL